MSHGTTFTPTFIDSRVVCSVLHCRSKAVNDRHLRFHAFPKRNGSFIYFNNNGKVEKIDRLDAWIKSLKIEKENPISSNAVVCSLHFEPKDYIEKCKLIYHWIVE